MDPTKRIAFIGGGNMASAMVGGLLSTGFPVSQLSIAEPWEEAHSRIRSQFPGIALSTSNEEAVEFKVSGGKPADVVIFAVKPQVMKKVAEELSSLILKHQPLIISIAAGIMTQDLSKWLCSSNPSGSKEPTIVRVMPNTPALVNEGASGLYASSSVSESGKTLAFNILQSISKKAYWVEKESHLDVVTGISGSGPAYFFLMVECLTKAGVDAGLPYDVAKGLASQTCLGAGRMLTSTEEDPAELRRKVTSPNGTTEAAIKSMESAGIREVLEKGVQSAISRSLELGEILGKL